MAKVKLRGGKVSDQEVLNSSVIGYHIMVDGLVVLLEKAENKEYEYALRKKCHR